MRPFRTIGSGIHEAGDGSFVIRPNRSLPVSGMVVLFVVLSALVLSVGIGFMLAGAWMVLVFAGLEVVVVGVLCGWLYRHMDDCEMVVVEPERVRIDKRCGTGLSRYEFPRYWVRVTFEVDGKTPGTTTRLLIGSHGRFVRLAEEINAADRAVVAQELKELLRR